MYYYIINPAAGGGKINKVQSKLQSRLKELGIYGEFVKSIGEGDIAKLTKIGIDKGYKTIVAVGGDGTIGEVINNVQDSNITLGIIPSGSSNELAKLLGIPDWQSACNILAARKTEIVDLGKVGNNLFVTNLSIGFDNFLSENIKLQKGPMLKKAIFLKKFVTEARGLKPVPAVLEFQEGYSVEANSFSMTVSSGRSYDYMPNKTKPQDGSLDVILINKLPFGKMLKYSTQSGDVLDYNYFSVFKTKKVKISTKKPVDVFADGQKITKTPVVVELANKKLRVIVSKERKF